MLKSKHIERKCVVFIQLLIVNHNHIFIKKKKTNLILLAFIVQDNWLNNSVYILRIKLYVKCVSCTQNLT